MLLFVQLFSDIGIMTFDFITTWQCTLKSFMSKNSLTFRYNWILKILLAVVVDLKFFPSEYLSDSFRRTFFRLIDWNSFFYCYFWFDGQFPNFLAKKTAIQKELFLWNISLFHLILCLEWIYIYIFVFKFILRYLEIQWKQKWEKVLTNYQ